MNNAAHINLAELALHWGVKILHVRTDSLCVNHWVSDTLSGKARVRTKTASEMLIRRRLSTIKKLAAAEYELGMDVTMVTSNCNLADGLTRVPQKWYESMKKGDELAQPVCAASMEEPDDIAKIHYLSGHPGVQRTCYFVQLTNPSVSTSTVRDVVKRCQTCQSIDPASVKWRKGKLGIGSTWSRLTMDITHYSSQHFLTLDCGPSRFAAWRPLLRQDSTSVIRQLESVFYERGPLEEILTDNDTAFRSKQFECFLDEWGIQLRLRCAHVQSGNGIVERCHRSIKRIAARKQCTVTEAM